MEGTDKNKTIRDWLQLLAIITTAIVTFSGFFLKDILLPKEEAGIKVSASLKDEGVRDSIRFIHVYLHTDNPASRLTYVPALWYVLTGHKHISIEKEKSALPKIATDIAVKNYIQYSYKTNEIVDVLAQQRIVYEKSSWWGPKATTHDDMIIPIPAFKNYDYLTLNVQYFHTRNQEDIDSIKWYNNEYWDMDFKLKESQFKEGTQKEKEDWQWKTFSGFNWFNTSLVLKK